MCSRAHFQQFLYIPDLWKANRSLLKVFEKVTDITGKSGSAKINVLASRQLLAVIFKRTHYKGAGVHGDDDPIKALNALLHRCFQQSHLMFNGSWSPEALLMSCDFILDKAYIRAVIAASKWLGPDRFPNGLFGEWPPNPPADYNTAGFQPI